MGRRMLRIVGIGLLALVLGTIGYEYAAAYRPARTRAADLERGRWLYGTLCHDCHGGQMLGRTLPTTNVAVPPLNKPGFRVFFYTMPADMEGFVADLIGTGRGDMPAFGPTVSAADRRALAAFIHAVNVGEAVAP